MKLLLDNIQIGMQICIIPPRLAYTCACIPPRLACKCVCIPPRLACTCACIPPRLSCKCACIPPSSKILCQAMSLCKPMINPVTSRAASEPDNPGFLVCPYLIGNCPFRSAHFLAMSFLSLGPLLTEN